MKRPVVSLLVVLCIFVFVMQAAADPVMKPVTRHFDFENGSVGAWSSYPPSQDTAYDPTIWVKPLYADKNAANRALYREITPNYEIDYIFGVRKLFDMYVDNSSVLSFKCFIKSNRDIGGVRVRFGFADGTDVERTIPFNTPLAWRDCKLALSNIIPRNSVKKLDAVAFMAICFKADPENLLRFGIEDVTINGMQESQWNFSEPQVHKLAEWPGYIAGKHYRENETITISGRAPFKSGSVAVILSRALTGETVKTLRMKNRKGAWSLTIPLNSKSGITAGMWRATVRASSKEHKNNTLSTDLVFLVKRAQAPKNNPRLLLSTGDAAKILEKASSGRMKTIWDNLQKNAQRRRNSRDVSEFKHNLDAYDEKYWLPTYGGYVQAIRTPSEYVRANGVVYGLSGDTAAGDAACSALVMMAEWPSYVHPHILNQGQFTYWPVGQILGDLAIGYDMVYGHFIASERRAVADALYSKGITEVFKEYVRDNRVSSNTSNWIGDVTAGGILCALAVMNDFSDEDLEPYLTGMILKLDALIKNGFGQDGSYGEGFSYLAHAMHCVNPALKALDTTFGITFNEKLKNAYKFLLYQSDASTKKLYDFGDSTDRLGRMSHFTYLLSEYRDPHLKWLYDLTPGTSDVDLILMDDSIPSKSPDDLPAVTLFRDTGTAIFRSGFEHDDFMLVFRCGPFYNHQHFDQGTFHLSDRGDNFLYEMGKSSYYNDPWYQKLIIQPGGHNCILVDRNPESQRAGDLLHDVPAWNNHAVITDFVTFDHGAFVSGKLDPLYKGKLSVLRRNILYSAPRTVVVIDEAVNAGDVGEINLRFHAPYKDCIAVNGNNASIEQPDGKLTIHTIAPASYTPEVLKRPLTTTEFGGEDAVTMKERGFLQLSAGLGNGAVTFVNVLTTDESVISGLDEKIQNGHVSFSIGAKDFCVNTDAGKELTYGGVTTNALVYTAFNGGFMAMRATKVSIDGIMRMSADKPVSLVLQGGKLVYSAEDASTLTVKIDSRPRLVTMDGQKITGWKYVENKGFTIDLEAGSGEITIE